MFAFVCPIRHPKSSNQYDEVVRLLNLTIQSISNQNTDEKFVFLVVCNQIPDLAADVDRIKFLQVNFPPPDNKKGAEVGFKAVTQDKGTKISAGLLELAQYKPDYVYIMDGDDWFHTDVIESLKGKKADMWYANSGYVINYAKKSYIKKFGVCRYCGSTFIYNYEALMRATLLSEFQGNRYDQRALLNYVDEFVLNLILGNHRHQFHFFKNKGFEIKEMPIAPVAWLLNTGENHSAQPPGEFGLPITKAFLNTFGITSLAPSEQKATLMLHLRTLAVSMSSFFGWLRTDKDSKMV